MPITPKPALWELPGAGACVVLFDAGSISVNVELGGNCEAAVIGVESVVLAAGKLGSAHTSMKNSSTKPTIAIAMSVNCMA
jgi:hypothetical protein